MVVLTLFLQIGEHGPHWPKTRVPGCLESHQDFAPEEAAVLHADPPGLTPGHRESAARVRLRNPEVRVNTHIHHGVRLLV